MLLDADPENQELEELIVRATHVYAVRSVFNSRKAESARKPKAQVRRAITAYYKTAKMHCAHVYGAFTNVQRGRYLHSGA
eukprot:5729924-Karenia_brevis.AAC.1